MPKLAFNQALKNIEQGQFGLLYYLAGPEKYFHDRFIERLIAKVFADKGSRSLNLSLLYGSENTQQQLMAAVEGFPMLSDYKLVIVRDFEQMKISDADTFISYLNHPQKTTILVLGASKSASGKAFSELNRLAQVIECKAIPLRNISGWITDLCKQKGYTIDFPAVQFLIDHVGNTLLNLDQEIEKIINYKNDSSQISVSDIEQVTGISREANLFALQKALAKKQLAASLKIANHLLESGYDVSAVNAVLFKFFQRALIAASLRRRGLDKRAIDGQMKMQSFQMREVYEALQHFSLEGLKSVIHLLHETDIASKTSAQAARPALEMLCFKICRI